MSEEQTRKLIAEISEVINAEPLDLTGKTPEEVIAEYCRRRARERSVLGKVRHWLLADIKSAQGRTGAGDHGH